MREVDQSVKSPTIIWRLALLIALFGAVAPMVALEAGGVSAAATKPTAHTTHTAPYGGGRLMAADPSGGYWTVSGLGAVTSHGGAPAYGSAALSGLRLFRPIVGMAATPDGGGYWLVASDGGVFTFGDAPFYGSTGAIRLNQPIVGIAATPDGRGYWLVASDGGIFTYGDAPYYGSTGDLHLNQPVVAMAPTPDGGGYWLVASDGGIFTYGDAPYYGSTGTLRLNAPVVAMASTPDGQGYWLAASDGGIFTFGDANFQGSGGSGVVGIIVSPSTGDYTLVQSDGTTSAPSLAPGGTCGAAGTMPPTGSTYAGYSLQNAMTGPQIVQDAAQDGYSNYAANGDEVLPPSGWIEGSHVVVTNNALEELGYTDPAHPGVTGAGMNIGDDQVNGYGGFSYCFSLSGSNWQNVAVVFIAWPADSVWQEGEIDLLAGTTQQLGMDVFQVGGCTGPCNVVWQSNWPASAGSGLHKVTVLWNPISGESFYLDGALIATMPPGLGIPTSPHVPTMQIQDLGGNSSVPASAPLTASLYWIARYAYN
jgi:hypothetical protein